MIKINGTPIEVGAKSSTFSIGLHRFPDGTLHLDGADILLSLGSMPTKDIEWFYDGDEEFMILSFITKFLQQKGIYKINLYLYYVPNARQDRVKYNSELFTLKYFTEMINDLHFYNVFVLDVHSSVSEALINNIVSLSPKKLIRDIPVNLESTKLFYPDEGAMKRYSDMFQLPYNFGIKKRDWKTGDILGLDVSGDLNTIENHDILIIDDICSKGGTFYHSAKKLKELGAKDIYLWVTHCENTVLEGDLLKGDLVKKVFTTNSIFTNYHPKIGVVNLHTELF